MSAVSRMENPEKFRILGLPYVAFKEILSMWNPFELIDFSQINATTKAMIKQFTKSATNKFEICVLIDAIPTLTIGGSGKFWEYKMTSDKSRNRLFFAAFTFAQIEKFSEDVVLGFKSWVEYVTDIFNLKIQILFFYPDKLTNSMGKSYIDWLKTQSDSIKCCEIDGKRESDDVISYFLENLNISNDLDLTANLTENFRGKLENVSEYLCIDPSKFVTLDQLLKFESQQIRIRNSRLSNQELSRFLTSWMSLESNLNMTVFETTIQTLASVEEIVKGLPEEKTIQGNPDAKWQLKRDDGKTAILNTSPVGNYFLLGISVI